MVSLIKDISKNRVRTPRGNDLASLDERFDRVPYIEEYRGLGGDFTDISMIRAAYADNPTGRPLYLQSDLKLDDTFKAPDNFIIDMQGKGSIGASKYLPDGAFLIDRNTIPSGTGVRSGNFEIRRGFIRGANRNMATTAGYVSLMRLIKYDRVVIDNNRFRDHRYIIASIFGCNNVTVSDNWFRNWGRQDGTPGPGFQGGMALIVSSFATDDTPSINVDIHGNKFHDGNWTAISCYAQDFSIHDNIIWNVKEAGIFGYRARPGDASSNNAARGNINDNKISHVRTAAVTASGVEIGGLGVTVESNGFFDLDASAVDVLDGSKDVIVRNNNARDAVRDNVTYLQRGAYSMLTSNDTAEQPTDVVFDGNTHRDSATPKICPYGFSLRSIGSSPVPTPALGLVVCRNDFKDGYLTAPVNIVNATNPQVFDNISSFPDSYLNFRVDKFTANGVWTKPDWATRVIVELISGSAGGGSGGSRASGVAAGGGSSGTPGVMCTYEFNAADLPATVNVSIGAPGVGGDGVNGTDLNGNNGTTGGITTFGTFARALGVNPGNGGSNAGGAGVGAPGERHMPPYTNAAASGVGGTTAAGTTGANGPGKYGSMGGGGGGLSAANAFSAGGSSGFARIATFHSRQNAGGLTDGAQGVDGLTTGLPSFLTVGDSGGGGAGSVAGPGGRGGDGAAPGGAGGGGGGARNGQLTGRGGHGARGEAWITCYR